VHDRDSKFSHAFDEVFRTEGIKVIRTPDQVPKANAHAERWVRTLRADCLDRILILGRRHLEHVLRVDRKHYNEHRPLWGAEIRCASRENCGLQAGRQFWQPSRFMSSDGSASGGRGRARVGRCRFRFNRRRV
jgi:hypothetical protein